MRLTAPNGVMVDVPEAQVAKLLSAGFAPELGGRAAKDAPKGSSTRKRRTTKK